MEKWHFSRLDFSRIDIVPALKLNPPLISNRPSRYKNDIRTAAGSIKGSTVFNYSVPCKCHIFLLEMCVGNLLKQEKRCLIFMSNLLGRVFNAFYEVMQAPCNFFLLQYELAIQKEGGMNERRALFLH